MTEPSPTLAQWRALYAAAGAFGELAPWEFMFDSALFCVGDPAGGETAYCSVLGMCGEVFGLVAYLGSEGLALYEMIQSGRIGPGDDEVVYFQRCLIVTFGPRKELQDPDLAVVKELKLKYRGRNSRPLFRSHRPGFMPWYLTQAEVVFFTHVLEQAVDVCSRVEEAPRLLDPREESLCFSRARAADGSWKDMWIAPELCKPDQEPEAPPVDAVRLARLAKSAKKRQGTWEADVFHAPVLVRDRDRPYFPRIVALADHASGYVLDSDALDPAEPGGSALVERFLRLAERLRALPGTVTVQRQGTADALRPVAEGLGIAVRFEEHLPMLSRFRAEMPGGIGGC